MSLKIRFKCQWCMGVREKNFTLSLAARHLELAAQRLIRPLEELKIYSQLSAGTQRGASLRLTSDSGPTLLRL